MIVEGTTRQERYESVTDNVCNLEDCKPPVLRFIAVEQSHENYVWAFTADTLEELKTLIDESETVREDVLVYDLDTGLFHPVTFAATISEKGYEV